MNPLRNVIILALALLLTQNAVAVHDIHCLDGEHDQTCEIYFTQDHSASADIAVDKLECVAFAENLDLITAQHAPTVFVSAYSSRAPPQLL